MKSKVTIIGLSAALLGCAGSYKRPESIESKMERFKSQSAQINKVPDFHVLSDVSFQNKRTRGPASSASKKDMQQEHTNKKLYFLTLLSQYNNLAKYSTAQTVPAVNICPSFHSILVDHKEKFEAEGYSNPTKVNLNFAKIYTPEVYKNSAQLSHYPELMLPVTKEELHPTVAEYMSSNSNLDASIVMGQAIDLHISKTHEELNELCDTGASSNYYIYENLITHVKSQGFKPNATNMKTLFKTSIFTNVALIKSFDKAARKSRGRGIASASQVKENYTDAVVDRLGVEWSDSYFETMTNNR